MKNYYSILGIHLTASLEEIRSAFRTCAMRYHPDKNVGKEEGAEKIFKEVLEAYEVLSDLAKKVEYDRILQRFLRNSIRVRGSCSTALQPHLVDKRRNGQQSNSRGNSKDPVDGTKYVNIDVDVPLDLIYTGGFHPFHYGQGIRGQKKLLLIPVKCGCPDGTKVKLDISDRSGGLQKTVLIATIRSKKHPFFERVGESLETTVRLPLFQFLKLEDVSISGLDGESIKATLPDISMIRRSPTSPSCMEGWSMVEGKGIPDPDENSKRGNIFVRFLIDYTG